MREIIATFTDGRQARYTAAILDLLKTDPATLDIMDAETGEIIWTA